MNVKKGKTKLGETIYHLHCVLNIELVTKWKGEPIICEDSADYSRKTG